jgi:ABC-type uncharacterized transport system substrate-binding protein
MKRKMMDLSKLLKRRQFINLGLIFVLCTGVAFHANASGKNLKKCLIVASYHDGFLGQHLKVDGARSVLEGKCEIRQFNMDTKRNPSPEFCKKMALEAKALIESWKPDVVIAIEDNASKYLVKPYFKDAEIPIVFSGVDWTAKEYGYPYSNATGMIEVFPIKQLIEQIKRIIPDAKTAVYIRGDRLSAEKGYNRYQKVFKKFGIEIVDSPLVSFDEFKKAYIEGQNYDFIILHNYSGIKGWDDALAKEFILEQSKKLVVSQSKWMANFSVLAITLVTEEQGEYAAEVALKILEGGIKLPGDLLRKAEKVK